MKELISPTGLLLLDFSPSYNTYAIHTQDAEMLSAETNGGPVIKKQHPSPLKPQALGKKKAVELLIS